MEKRLLIVDDNLTHCHSLEALLEDEGYTCEVANDGEDALEFLRAMPLDLVITDFRLPSLSGIQLIERISHQDFPHHPPSILLTGELDTRILTLAEKAGAWATMTKPYDVPSLLETIHNILQHQRPPSSPSKPPRT